MADMSLAEKTYYAVKRAALLETQKHFFDAAQPFFPLGFSVTYRNPGHWDIYARQCPGMIQAFYAANPGGMTSGKDGGTERAFVIRGETGNVIVHDERWDPHRTGMNPMAFRSVSAAMLWICEELMQEPVND